MNLEPLIDSARVEAILKDCLIESDDPTGRSYVDIEGILHTYRFDPAKLEEHRDEIRQMLQNLPLAFRSVEGGGGGWSFLNACDDANGVQWTGLHWVMEMLFCLGIALDMATWALPRDKWWVFPGEMPYVVVKV